MTPQPVIPKTNLGKNPKCVDGICYRSTIGLKKSQHWIKVLVFLISTKQISTKLPRLGHAALVHIWLSTWGRHLVFMHRLILPITF